MSKYGLLYFEAKNTFVHLYSTDAAIIYAVIESIKNSEHIKDIKINGDDSENETGFRHISFINKHPFSISLDRIFYHKITCIVCENGWEPFAFSGENATLLWFRKKYE